MCSPQNLTSYIEILPNSNTSMCAQRRRSKISPLFALIIGRAKKGFEGEARIIPRKAIRIGVGDVPGNSYIYPRAVVLIRVCWKAFLLHRKKPNTANVLHCCFPLGSGEEKHRCGTCAALAVSVVLLVSGPCNVVFRSLIIDAILMRFNGEMIMRRSVHQAYSNTT